MKVIRQLPELGGLPGPLHAAIGVFDGVHLGHQAVIQSAIDSAQKAGGTPCVVTFDPHPVRVLAPAYAPRLLTSTAHKLRLLEASGASATLVLEFDRAFSETSATNFVEQLHAKAPRLERISVGVDWRFGRGGDGNVALLETLGRKLGFQVSAIPTLMIDGSPVSSTRIREAVAGGDFAVAQSLLGRPYTVLGTVIEGRKLGRELGFPTANLTVHSEQLPPTGVYAVEIDHGGRRLAGVANLGYRPSVEGEAARRLLEVHCLDWQGDLYGQDLEVRFVRFLRPEKTFDDLESLKRQIQKDSEEARLVLPQ